MHPVRATLVAVTLGSCAAFVLRAPGALPVRHAAHRNALHMRSDDSDLGRSLSQKLVALALGGLLTFQPASPPALLPHAYAAKASDASTSAGSRVNKDADSLLRYGLPINNKDVRDLQKSVELIKDNILAKRLSAAVGDANNAARLSSGKAAEKILASVRAEDRESMEKLLGEINQDLGPLAGVLGESNPRGSPQERDALDKAYKAQETMSAKLTAIEESMVPKGYKVNVPAEYAELPQLTGRTTIEFVVKKPGNAQFDIEGVLYPKAVLKMVIDGYTAPVTGGNIVDLVKKGFYTGQTITRSDGFVVQMGDPEPDNEKVDGYVPPGAKGPRKIPLEIFLKGDKDPIYGETFEEAERYNAQTTLPFQSYGVLGMARGEYDNDSASSQFFWLLFDSDLTPAGKNYLDGRYACFGYTVQGAEFLADVKEGDIIESAKVIS